MTWETTTENDGFIKLDNSCVRISRIESITTDPKKWGTTSSSGDFLYSTTVTMFSGARFTALVKDPDALARSIAGVEQ